MIETTKLFFADKPSGYRSWSINASRETRLSGSESQAFADLQLGKLFLAVFLRETHDFEVQRQLWLGAKAKNIPTPRLFTQAFNPQGEAVLVNNDFSNRDQKWAVSVNSFITTKLHDFSRRILELTPQQKTAIANDVYTYAWQAAQEDNQTKPIRLKSENPYRNPFTLLLPKTGELKPAVLMTNFDAAEESEKTPRKTLDENLLAALLFLRDAVGYFDRIPTDNPAYPYRDFYSNGDWQMLKENEFWYLKQLKQNSEKKVLNSKKKVLRTRPN